MPSFTGKIPLGLTFDEWRKAKGCDKVVDASMRWHDVERVVG